MNSVILMGRLTKDPEIRYSQGDQSMCIARYTLAVDRRRGRNAGSDEPTADFISCKAFGKSAEFAEKYLHKGTKICLRGHIQTGSYTNKDGAKVYTTDVIIDDQEFAESKSAENGYSAPQASRSSQQPQQASVNPGAIAGFMDIPDSIDEELPFN